MLKIFKKSYIKFVLGGAYLFAFEYLVTIFLTEVLKLKPHMAYMLALTLGVVFLYQYHVKITFNKTKITKRSTFIKFIATYAISYALNAFLVYILTQKITYLIAIPITNIVLSTIVYYTYKKIVFVN